MSNGKSPDSNPTTGRERFLRDDCPALGKIQFFDAGQMFCLR
uniref:Uncharacterized protein n=1 Tax=Anguilla anguilla TaxID=7936 RepID=A0A0E9Q3I9_ANGAN